MKKLLELRQQKAALKTQMRSMLDKADTEKRSLNEEEGKKFDELRAQADALEVEITRLEAVADDRARRKLFYPIHRRFCYRTPVVICCALLPLRR